MSHQTLKNLSSFEKIFGHLQLAKIEMENGYAGVEMTLSRPTWPNVFATWSVKLFPISNFVWSFCEEKIQNYLVPF